MSHEVPRRLFLKSVAALGSAFVVGLWYQMVGNKARNTSPKKVTLPISAMGGVFFHEHFIMVQSDENLHVISSKCTHMGCRINQLSGDRLLCPCHGSSFDLNGNVLSGPALKALPQLPFEIDASKTTITVTLS